jgi:hypothetical protein
MRTCRMKTRKRTQAIERKYLFVTVIAPDHLKSLTMDVAGN